MKKKINLIVQIGILFAVSYALRLNFIVPMVLAALFIYLVVSRKIGGHKKYNILYPTLIFVMMFGISVFLLEYRLSLFIPFSLLSILLTVLFNDLALTLVFNVGFSVTLMSFAQSMYGGVSFSLGMLALVSGISSSLFVYQARRRVTIFKTGLFAAAVQLAAFYALEYLNLPGWRSYLLVFLNGAITGVIAQPLVLFFEYLFKTITNMSLLELSDTRDSPLFREMILKAPGTYHHSLIVGNLAEAACEAIGANALLARVGAYYHDIGKVAKAEYFIENQFNQDASHDALAPSMSKLVVMNHVKEGVDLARKYRLNPAIVDFIAQHHGTSLVYYFYRRALEESDLEHEVKEDIYRYPGPKPKTKETAIVLLADSVEAASRSLKDTNSAKIEETVRKIINNKFIDGQLDDCELTLRDLETISSTFIRILGSVYHARVNYPESTSEDRNKEPAEESFRSCGKNKKGHS
ncbi:MAG: HDIG domain-containing protein [Candidatus Omnitrophica bacterium]|nr:HDIG domain-containing protein [Candidatus Omnitrophota bacterium]